MLPIDKQSGAVEYCLLHSITFFLLDGPLDMKKHVNGQCSPSSHCSDFSSEEGGNTN